MPAIFAAILITPALCLLCTGLVPSRIANRQVGSLRRAVVAIAASQLAVAIVMGVSLAAGLLSTVAVEPGLLPGAIAVQYDGVAALMFSLVSFVGWIICRYSVRYLDGEPTQGRYFRWTGFTIGAVSLLVISGNLLMFFGCWVMTSMGLHQLLLHYGHRPAAQRAAWTKFTISRIGDAALLGAIALIYAQFKTLNLSELFAALEMETVNEVTPAMTWAGLLLVIGAVTKSAQFPFHTWLPLTMETPTPVSALMHAGIVNAGGYLMIRTSPLLQLTPIALSILAIIGAITACCGAVVMLTQTSIKKQLAYSTMAQMGFMMLQCGLGSFSAAMLHILAHSLYKAHAFLSSGSVISQGVATVGARRQGEPTHWTTLITVSVMIAAFLGIAMAACGVNLAGKPGGVLLGGILCLALTDWIGQVMRVGSHRLLIRALASAAVLCLVYAIGFATVDQIVASSLPTVASSDGAWFAAAVVVAGFAGMFLLHRHIASIQASPLLNRYYVHASNGFYLDQTIQRVFGSLARN